MKAVMIIDDYSDLTLGFEYTVKRVFYDGHIMLEGSPRRYKGSSFHITNRKGKIISLEEAFWQYKVDKLTKKNKTT